ncbi:hypothetical protein HNP46_005702 [Pseudomonas nitritireducens]|uniref:RNA ligase domain-containing protein n=1 Tax=Pseudomonas nitroreducens TaxID=46680 RepID=A0A7W7P4N0_PSENT|nr:RNA ligase family protein [Pseudomonas nitritireducens]MBB4866795.1 hypothetical protein [Pseudomonas nitritireducens]
MKSPILLSEQQFVLNVRNRDKDRCVVCRAAADHAHHIMDTRLFDNGGHYLGNGVSLCDQHRQDAMTTLLNTQKLRDAAGIPEIIIPDHLVASDRYDRYGNQLQPNGTRMKGELFDLEDVQWLLLQANLLGDFNDLVKAARTTHLSYSPGATSDDKIWTVEDELKYFEGKEVVSTEKMDGENASLYRHAYHARSLDSDSHPSQHWVRRFWGMIRHNIPEGWRIQGEDLYAIHSIEYRNLPSYFLGFFLWNEKNICLSYDDMLEWFQLLDVTPVKTLYTGIYDKKAILKAYEERADQEVSEGFVVRLRGEFHYRDFRRSVAKYVRKGHVTTDTHWKHQQIRPNGLA